MIAARSAAGVADHSPNAVHAAEIASTAISGVADEAVPTTRCGCAGSMLRMTPSVSIERPPITSGA